MVDPIAAVMENRQLTRSMQTLMGIVSGLTADGSLNDQEILFLNTWLSENGEICRAWPASAVHKLVREVLADGVITPDEREHLQKKLVGLAGQDFSSTGATAPEVARIPYHADPRFELRDKTICLTGEFMYGTRAACERVSEKVGAVPVPNVSKRLSYLVVGTHVSPHWISESYGRKIMSAMDLQSNGHSVAIIPEKAWFDSLSS